MKKLFSVLLVFLLAFNFTSSFALASVGGAVFSFLKDVALDEVLDFCKSIISTNSDSISKRTEAARAYYFYKILNDDFVTGLPVFDDSGIKFSSEILDYYYKEYVTANKYKDNGLDVYDSNGNVFIQAAGYPNTKFSLSLLSFHVSDGFDFFKSGAALDGMSQAEYEKDCFIKYYQSMLARFIIEHNEQAIDPAPGKSGLEIAPAYVSSDEFAESLEKDNDYYFPRKDYRKVSYRNDPTFQRFVKFKATNNNRQYYPTIKYEDKFLYGSGNDLYFVLYANVDDDKRGYGVYQYHLTFEDVKNEEGTVVKRVPHIYRWNVVTQTEVDAVEVSSSVTNGFLNFSDTANCEYVRSSFENKIMKLYCFNTFDDFMNGNSSYCYYKFNLDSDNLDCISRDMSTRFSYLTCTSSQHNFVGSYEKHAETCSSTTDDLGYICDGEPLSLTSYLFDISRIPKGQIVTINGDTIYNYTITNPETGDSSKFGDYIENNYTYITNNNGGSVGGDVTVGGKIDVVGSVAVDVNVNVNGAGGSGSVNPSDFTSAENVDLTKYYDNAVEQSTGFQKFLKDFFGFLPAELLGLILFAVSMAIICRVFGR